jgi:hypothetical protein
VSFAGVGILSPSQLPTRPRSSWHGRLHAEKFSDYFFHHLLTRTARVESDLVDQLFNSSEMRLARALLLLANYGVDLSPQTMSITMSQETLAAMIGTSRPSLHFSAKVANGVKRTKVSFGPHQL